MMKTNQFTTRFAGGNSCQSAAHLSVGATAGFLVLAVSIAFTSSAAFGQALPAAQASPISTGFEVPLTAGTLSYGVSVSESLSWGYYGNQGAVSATNLTGDLGYISGSLRNPFSMVFSGGHSWGTSTEPSYTYLDLALSQVLNVGRWNFILSDSVSYLPGTSIGTLSGVPGAGDVGIQVGTSTGQGVLTNYSTRIYNSASVSVARQLTGKTSLDASGTYFLTHFLNNSTNPGSSGLDNYSASGSGGINHELSPRTSFGGNYTYSRTNFTGQNYGVSASTISSQIVSGQVSRHFTRQLILTASAGPEWTTVDSSNQFTTLGVFANVSAGYTGQFSESSLNYSRGTNSGYGVIGGSTSDSVTFTSSRNLGRVWHAGVTAAFTRTASLPVPGTPSYNLHTIVGTGQISRALARSLSCYASYTAENQTSAGAATTVDVFTGLSQVVGFGLTFSPMPIHVGHQ